MEEMKQMKISVKGSDTIEDFKSKNPEIPEELFHAILERQKKLESIDDDLSKARACSNKMFRRFMVCKVITLVLAFITCINGAGGDFTNHENMLLFLIMFMVLIVVELTAVGINFISMITNLGTLVRHIHDVLTPTAHPLNRKENNDDKET